jgi:hypothetical protein
MKGFEKDQWKEMYPLKNKTSRIFQHKQFPFIKIQGRKITKSLPAHNFSPPQPPMWQFKFVGYIFLLEPPVRTYGVKKFNPSYIEKFFHESLNSSIGKHFIFKMVFDKN